MNKFVIWTSTAVGLIATVVLLANPAFAALTFSDTGVSSSGIINLDGAGAVSVGTSAATSVVIGKSSINTTINGNVGIGTASPAELLSLGLAGTTKGVLSLAGNTSGKVIIQPASAAGTWSLTLPTSAGSNGQYLMTDGAGVTSWTTIPASPAARTLRIVGIGDSHMNGSITTFVASADDSIGSYGLFSPKDEQWTASGTVSPVFNDNDAINSVTGSSDPNIGKSTTAGSFINRIPYILRSAYPYIDRIRIANLGIGGSSAYTWAGEQAGAYIHPAANATDGDTITVAGVVYTFRNSPTVANDVQIGAAGTDSVTNLAHAINGFGSGIGAGTTANPSCWVVAPASSNYLVVTALATGTAGNSITIQSSNTARVQAVDAGLTPVAGPLNLSGGSNTSALYNNGKTALAAGSGFGTPDIFLVTLGTNDSARCTTAGHCPDYQTELQKLVTNIRTDYPTAKIILWHPIVSSISARNIYLSQTVNPAVDAIVAADPTHVSTIDVYGLGTGAAPTYILAPSNGTHATIYGYEVIAQLFAAKIVSALGL